jgi:hypothetical protein
MGGGWNILQKKNNFQSEPLTEIQQELFLYCNDATTLTEMTQIKLDVDYGVL